MRKPIFEKDGRDVQDQGGGSLLGSSPSISQYLYHLGAPAQKTVRETVELGSETIPRKLRCSLIHPCLGTELGPGFMEPLRAFCYWLRVSEPVYSFPSHE